MALVVSLNREQFRRADEALLGLRGGLREAIERAINDTLKRLRTQVDRGIREELKVTKATVFKHVTIRRARRTGSPSGILFVRGDKRIPLLAFGARQIKSGVSYKLNRTGARKKIKSAFIARMPRSGHRGVFIERRLIAGRSSVGFAERDAAGNIRRGSFRTTRVRARRRDFRPGKRTAGLPIQELRGPSILGVYRRHLAKVTPEFADEVLARRLEFYIDFILKRKNQAR